MSGYLNPPDAGREEGVEGDGMCAPNSRSRSTHSQIKTLPPILSSSGLNTSEGKKGGGGEVWGVSRHGISRQSNQKDARDQIFRARNLA